MTKANKAIFWSLVVCIMALVVGLCFVGTTFARYTSSGTGTGSVGVAKWDVAVTPNASFSTTLTASPSDGEYSGDSSYSSDYVRSNQSQPQLAAQITNSGDVSATVTAEVTGDLTFNFTSDYSSDERFSTSASSYITAASNHFTLELWQDDGGYYDSGSYSNTSSGNTAEDLTALGSSVTVAPSASLYIYADVLWVSDIESCFGDSADEFDTFCGMYLTSISFTINFTAVQASAN